MSVCGRRINPFDQSGTELVDTPYDNAAFSQKFTVRFLGSMEVKKDRGRHCDKKGGKRVYYDSPFIHYFSLCLFFWAFGCVGCLFLFFGGRGWEGGACDCGFLVLSLAIFCCAVI